MNKDLEKIIQIFLVEAAEKLDEYSTELLALEQTPANAHSLKAMIRSIHTIKGSSGIFHSSVSEFDVDETFLLNIQKLTEISHVFEDLLVVFLENETIIPTSAQIELFFKTEEKYSTLINLLQNFSKETIDIEDMKKEISNELHSIKLPSEDMKKEQPTLTKKEQSVCFHIFLIDNIQMKFAATALLYKKLQNVFGEHAISFSPTKEELKLQTDFDFITAKVQTTKNKEEISSLFETKFSNVKNITFEEEVPQEKPQETETSSLQTEHTKETTPLTQPSYQTIKVSTDKINDVFKHVSNLVILENSLSNYVKNVKTNPNIATKDLIETSEKITSTIKNLHDSIMKIRMTPLEEIFKRFPIDVRKLSKELHKAIDLKIFGRETEIDKMLLDELPEPLMHIIRNSISHGIETEDERLLANKPVKGTITLSAKHEDGFVVIEVMDDGKGIDVNKVVNKALERNIITTEQAEKMSETEKINLIFHSGLSTEEHVNTVSGRGVGMDIVSSVIKSLKGQIEVRSILGVGTTSIIRLPLTLATIEALMTEINGESYAFPISQFKEVITYDPKKDIRYINNQPILLLEEQDSKHEITKQEIPIFCLRQFFNLPNDKVQTEKEEQLAIIFQTGHQHVAITIDSYSDPKTIVMTNLGNYIGNIPGISGCSLQGDSSISLIIDINGILNHLQKQKRH